MGDPASNAPHEGACFVFSFLLLFFFGGGGVGIVQCMVLF